MRCSKIQTNQQKGDKIESTKYITTIFNRAHIYLYCVTVSTRVELQTAHFSNRSEVFPPLHFSYYRWSYRETQLGFRTIPLCSGTATQTIHTPQSVSGYG